MFPATKKESPVHTYICFINKFTNIDSSKELKMYNDDKNEQKKKRNKTMWRVEIFLPLTMARLAENYMNSNLS